MIRTIYMDRHTTIPGTIGMSRTQGVSHESVLLHRATANLEQVRELQLARGKYGRQRSPEANHLVLPVAIS